MGEINVAEAATAGLRLIGRRPLSVLTWGVLLAGYVGLIFVLFGGTVVASIIALVQAAQSGAEPPGRLIATLIFSMLGFVFFLAIGAGLLSIVIRTAAIRAELEPEARGFAYLRFGSQEAWVLASSFVLGLVLVIASIVVSIPVGILFMAAAFGSGAGFSPHGFGIGGGLLGVRAAGQLIVWAVAGWLWLRLVFGLVLSYQQRQFRLFEGWTASRGHVWRMFLTMLLVWVMLFALGVVIWGVDVGVFFGTLASAGLGGDPRALLTQPPSAWIAMLTPWLIAVLIGFVVQVSASAALTWGAVARMWTQLYPDAEAAKAFT
jgi:hypothetical protein